MAKFPSILLAVPDSGRRCSTSRDRAFRPNDDAGAIASAVTLDRICTEAKRHHLPPSTKLSNRILAADSVLAADRYPCECDHNVPIAREDETVANSMARVPKYSI